MRILAWLAVAFVVLPGTGVPTKSAASLRPIALAAAQDTETETVLSTFRARAGKEDELQKTLNQEWATLRKLGLVLADPHILLKGKDESGKPIFVEVLTWKDHDAPDHAPPEVQAIWKQLESLCEARLGHRGIEFPEFEIVSSAP